MDIVSLLTDFREQLELIPAQVWNEIKEGWMEHPYMTITLAIAMVVIPMALWRFLKGSEK